MGFSCCDFYVGLICAHPFVALYALVWSAISACSHIGSWYSVLACGLVICSYGYHVVSLISWAPLCECATFGLFLFGSVWLLFYCVVVYSLLIEA